MTMEDYLEITGGITQAQFVRLVRRAEERGAGPEEWAELRKIGDAMIQFEKDLAARVLGEKAA